MIPRSNLCDHPTLKAIRMQMTSSKIERISFSMRVATSNWASRWRTSTIVIFCKLSVNFNFWNVWSFISVISTDYKNPALILNDPTLTWKVKCKFLRRQKWFWLLVLLVVFLIAFPSTFSVAMTHIQLQSIIIGRSVWGADGFPLDLDYLGIPVRVIVVTHTNDENGSCSTEVGISQNSNVKISLSNCP